MPKMKNSKKNKKDTKYNADNEIIIGVTTKPKEKVRVEKKKTTRTNVKSSKNKINKNNKKNAISKEIKAKKNIVNKDITKENKIKKINLKNVLISVLVLLLIILGGTIYYLTTPNFNISTIMVYGSKQNSTDTYVSLSQIVINETNIFAFTSSAIKEKLKENPYVEDVKVERKLPNKLELHITERTIDYQVNYLNNYVYLNNQGYILEVSEEKKDVPEIIGISSVEDNISLGERLNNEDLIKLDTILKIVNYCKYNSVDEEITQINASDESNYILEFKNENKVAYIGDSSNITEKMTAVTKILEVEKGKKGKIHATEDELKRNRIYFSEEE